MKATALEIYPETTDHRDIVYLGKVVGALSSRGLNASYHAINDSDSAWAMLKEEIQAGYPLIFDDISDLTPAGHFVVVVGYKEYMDGKRDMIVYDPYGKWEGEGSFPSNYDRNSNEPSSEKGSLGAL